MKTYDKGDSENYTTPISVRELISRNYWNKKEDRLCKATTLRIVK
jgi:hypothetical protein